MMKKPFSLIYLILLCGCSLEPPYKAPLVPTPLHWKAKTEYKVSSTVHDRWWHIFNDEILDSLEKKAIASNQNVYVAIQKIAEARAISGVDASHLYPHLNLNPNYLNWGQLYKLIFPVPLPIPQYFRAHQVQYEIPLNLSWELDVFGKIRSQYKADLLNVQAQVENLESVLLTLTSDLASAYFQVRMFDAEIDLLKEMIAVQKDQVGQVHNRFEKGLVNLIDLEQAKLTLANQEAIYYEVVKNRKVQENKIGALLGMPASCFSLEHHPLQHPPPDVPAYMPSQLLCKRPDIREQERIMASKHALLGVAYASFFPSLNLTGALGVLSPDLKSFLTWKSRLWAYGANMSQTIFDAGENCSKLDATWARFFEASGTYIQTVFTAFQEVEDALVNLEMQKLQTVSLVDAVQASAQVSKLATNRYNKGLTSYLDVISAKEGELKAKIYFNQLQGIRYLSTIQLVKAMGGWD